MSSSPAPSDRGECAAATPLTHGDVVVIVADSHPWHGQKGTLFEQPAHRKLRWRVYFQDKNGLTVKAAVDENEVRRV